MPVTKNYTKFELNQIKTYRENTTFGLTVLASLWPWKKVWLHTRNVSVISIKYKQLQEAFCAWLCLMNITAIQNQNSILQKKYIIQFDI